MNNNPSAPQWGSNNPEYDEAMRAINSQSDHSNDFSAGSERSNRKLSTRIGNWMSTTRVPPDAHGTMVLGQLLIEEGLTPDTQPFTDWMRNILEGKDPIANERTAASKAEKQRLFDAATRASEERIKDSLERKRVSEEIHKLAEEQRVLRERRKKILGSHDLQFLPPREEIQVVEKVDVVMKPEEKIPPDIIQQWRKSGPEIVLEENESIYDPKTVQKIRDLLKDKRVLMFDQDGVITPVELIDDEVVMPTDNVVTAIRELHEQGYTFIYWTSRANATGEVYDMLLRSDLARLFTVVITRENTRLEKRGERANAVQMIDSSKSLNDKTRKKLTTCIKEGGKPNFGPRLIPKLPQCLTETCAMIDDHPWWDKEYFPDRSQDSEYNHAYPAFIPPSLFDPRNPNYAPREGNPPRDHFGTDWIQRINEGYPPPMKS